MRNVFLLVTVFVFFVNRCVAQCLVLDLKLNDCVSCRVNLVSLQVLSKQIPVYAVFEKNKISDSSDLEYKFTLRNYNISYVFNDEAYRKFHKSNQTSNWYLLNQFGEEVLQGDLKSLNLNAVADTSRLILDRLPSCNNCQFAFSENRLFILNMDLDKLQEFSKNGLGKISDIKPKDFDFNYLLNSLPAQDSIAFVKKGLLYNTKGKGFRPGFTWFDVDNHNNIYAMFEYIQPVVVGDSFAFDTRTCIVKYDSNANVNKVLLVDASSLKKFDNYTARFKMINSESFITVTHQPDKWFDAILNKNKNEKIDFITKYTLNKKGNTFSPTKTYTIDLPYIYKRKYFENYLSPELCIYPYISFRFSNELYNVSTGASTKIVDSSIYYSSVDLGNKQLGNEKFAVLALSTFKERDEENICIIYKVDQTVFIKVLSKDFEIKSVKQMSNIINGANVDDVFVDPYSKSVFFTFEGYSKIISIPLLLAGQ